MKSKTTQLDKAGRVVLPKPLRQQLNLMPGDKLKASVDGNSIKLEPIRTEAKLVRKGTVLVATSEFTEVLASRRVESLLARERHERFAAASGKHLVR